MAREHECKQALFIQELRTPLVFLDNTTAPEPPPTHAALHLRVGVAAVHVLVAALCSQLSSASPDLVEGAPPRAAAPRFCRHAHHDDSESAKADVGMQLGSWGAVSMRNVVSECTGGEGIVNQCRPAVQTMVELTLCLLQQLQAIHHAHVTLVTATAGEADNADNSTATITTTTFESTSGQSGAAGSVSMAQVIEAASACLDPKVPATRCCGVLQRVVQSVLGSVRQVLQAVARTAGFTGNGGIASCVTSLTTLAILDGEGGEGSGRTVDGDYSDEDGDEDDDNMSLLETLRDDLSAQAALYHLGVNPSHSRVRFARLLQTYALACARQSDVGVAIVAVRWCKTVCCGLIGPRHTLTLRVAREELRLRGQLLATKTAYDIMEEEKQLRTMLQVRCWVAWTALLD